ncbi:TPA: hypothetical protein NJ185_004586 [Vibrio parahaemolyticus]|uniref:hypothetical protein n=1 Tax=Vibrio parahaemolyticus TaxID=670 RepID=UPI002119E29B|nr:hypothetical protein [Vibrio parahaemolyticus]MCQ9057892.1 hypothetical protein [Vibrio parahaemolyticus]HCG6519809.1 hypothetical protein [Vibrio parahaemolyticus]HCH0198345.1 hypothetical protein [Vibrio parahaemolyticus]
MKVGKLLIFLSFFSVSSQADTVLDEFKQIESEASQLRMTVVKCYVQMKLLKREGWKSQACLDYKNIASVDGEKLKVDWKESSSKFKKNQSEGRYSYEEIAERMELMYSIKTHFDGFKGMPGKIKELRKT